MHFRKLRRCDTDPSSDTNGLTIGNRTADTDTDPDPNRDADT